MPETTDATTTDADTATGTDAEATTATTDTTSGDDLADEVAKWKGLSRKHEAASKANADKARQYDEFEESQKTEQQKLADAKAKSDTDAATARAEVARLTAAIKHNLSADDLELLGTHGTPDEIEARAERLAARISTADKARTAATDFGGGDRGSDVGKGVQQLTRSQLDSMTPDQINEALEKGQLDEVRGIKT